MPDEIMPLRAGPKAKVPEVRNAYRYLRGAHHSVAGVVNASQALAEHRRSGNSTTTGRPSGDEVDLLRSAIVLTSSGIDSAMQRILWDAGLFLIPKKGTAARAAYEAHLKQELAGKGNVDQNLREAMIESDPPRPMLDYYLGLKSKASFQGSGDLKRRVRNTLGCRIPPSRTRFWSLWTRSFWRAIESRTRWTMKNPRNRSAPQGRIELLER